ncbi:aspartyl protease [Synechococcus moorigangaii CMS01]|nr:aspartyl protease [Synechococcus moorigangaii CMS01]
MKKAPILSTIGWRECVALPDFKIPEIRAKIDTGAGSSSIHATRIHYFHQGDREMVRFQIHPHQHNIHDTVTIEAPLVEHRSIKSSNGQKQLRPVIETHVQLGTHRWLIELNLTNRSLMGYRMLLGRQALRKRFLVDVSKSFLQSQPDHPHHP